MGHDPAYDRLVVSLERLGTPYNLPPDWVLLQDLDALKDVPTRSRLLVLERAKREAVRRSIQERIDEIREAVEDDDELMTEVCLSAFRDDIKNYRQLSDAQQAKWIITAEKAASLGEGSLIYFIGTDDGPVKIGFTTNLPKRLKALQTASSRPLVVRLKLPGDRECEKTLHRRFAEFRLEGEWFRLSEEISSFIKSLTSRL